MNWICSCGEENFGSRRRCRQCGESKPTGTSAASTETGPLKRCKWRTNGRQCEHWAGIYPWPAPPNAEGWCGWHYIVKDHLELGDDYEEFERFCLNWLNRHYCCEWTHYPIASNWRFVTGTTIAEDRGMKPTPCEQAGCRYAEVIVPADFSVEKARAKLRDMMKTFEARKEGLSR